MLGIGIVLVIGVVLAILIAYGSRSDEGKKQ